MAQDIQVAGEFEYTSDDEDAPDWVVDEYAMEAFDAGFTISGPANVLGLVEVEPEEGGFFTATIRVKSAAAFNLKSFKLKPKHPNLKLFNIERV